MGPERLGYGVRAEKQGLELPPTAGLGLRRESPFYLNREGALQNEHFLISADILQMDGSYQRSAKLMLEKILEKGGKVSIVAAGSETPAAETQKVSDDIATLLSKYGADKLATIYLEPPEKTRGSKIWIRDYLGSFVPHREDPSSFCYLHSNTPHELHWSRKWQYEDILAKISGAEIEKPPIPIVGGDFALLGDDTLLLTTAFKRKVVDNSVDYTPEEQLKKLQATADLMGRSNILFVPSPFGNLSHADCVVCQVGSTVFIPEIPKECLSLSPHTRAVDKARDALIELTRTLKEKNFTVETLPMGLPGVDVIESGGKILSAQSESRNCLLPCNLIQFRNSQGELHILVPWNVESDRPNRVVNPSAAHYPKYQEEIKAKLKGAGATSVSFIPFLANASGGLHCITKNVSSDVAAVLNLHLGKPESASTLQASSTKS